jgi:PKD repeat protein
MAQAGQVVTFTGTFTEPGTADTHTFLWEIESSNGQTVPDGTDQAFAFTPTAAGTYTLTLTVTDDDAGSGADFALLTVEEEETETYVLYFAAAFRDDTIPPPPEQPKWPLLLLPGLVLGLVNWNWKRPK